MLTTGVDLIEVPRIEKSMKSPRFLARVFTQAERALFTRRGMNPQVVAGNFAAKEALTKALSPRYGSFPLDEMSLLRGEKGEPHFVFSGSLRELVEREGLCVSVSLSNTRAYAVAFVVCTKEEER